ncbi:rabgap/tbc domain-containing protein [Anaeramoeba flamelloides]|uniref:Rabgap/tbc domain-containing protein n=1 Tax=Anaeramoeba flamelloides TaxID=1746091 RepID=A0ABQ8YCP1_9EUKA|nr:rabgap/tbc domain-containing protein [Anaeramoeba flamelloides]
MSDFASPLIYLLEKESDMFWCFVNLMKRIDGNFKKDQKTINKKIEMIKFICRKLDPELYLSINDSKYDSDNFLFCYRWILVNFKREYKYEIVLQLWDKMFCNYLTSHLEVFMVFALLKLNRTKIVDQNLNFSEIMYVMNQFVRKKSYKVIVDESIQAVYNLATLIEDDIEKRERERLLEIEKKKMEELLREKLKIEEENRNIQENENQNEENENIKENEIKKGNDDEKEIKIINQESNIDQNTENCDEKNEVNENENTKNGNIQENENENEINENTQENKNENDKKNEDEKEIKIINQESNIGQDTENCDEKNEENENENTENGNIQENENGNEKNENIKENEIKKGNDDEKKSIQK